MFAIQISCRDPECHGKLVYQAIEYSDDDPPKPFESWACEVCGDTRRFKPKESEPDAPGATQ